MAVRAQRRRHTCLGEVERQQSRDKKVKTFKEIWVQISALPLTS